MFPDSLFGELPNSGRRHKLMFVAGYDVRREQASLRLDSQEDGSMAMLSRFIKGPHAGK
jgi:hypothetical protein